MSSALIEIQAPSGGRVALRSILKVNTEPRNYFIGKKVTVREVSYSNAIGYEGFYYIVLFH